jgi:photosystem II stability/assembly factor-like uncharacterized protein
VPGAGDASDLAIDPHDSARLYLASQGLTAGSGGTFLSTDAGANWRQVPNSQNTTELTLDASTNPATVYAADGNINRSVDGGATWMVLLTASRQLFQLPFLHVAVAPSNPRVLYASSEYGQVFASLDGGQAWAAFSRPRFGDDFGWLHPLAVDPADPTVLYTAGTGGMARSVGGRPWADIGRGLVAGGIVTLWYDVAGLTLFAGTDDAGVFARPVVAMRSSGSAAPAP